MTRGVACTSCKASLHPDLLDGTFYPCPRCTASQEVHVFPALSRGPVAAPIEAALIEGESACFYHAQKKAVIACESCGRFLCGLCDVEIGGVHRCPRCLESGKRKAQLVTLETRHIRYDRIALGLTTIGLLAWPITLVTSPAALFLVIRFWNRRSKILPRSHVLFILAGLFAIAEISGWGVLFYWLARHKFS